MQNAKFMSYEKILKLKSSNVFNILDGFSFLGSGDIFGINWPRETGTFFLPVGVSVKTICYGVVNG